MEAFTPTPANYQPPGVPQFLNTPFTQYAQPTQVTTQVVAPPVQKLSFDDIEKPLNSFAIANEHAGEAFAAPVVTTRAQQGPIPAQASQSAAAKETPPSIEDDFAPIIDELPEYHPFIPEPIVETTAPVTREPFVPVSKKKKRGPGRPKKRPLPVLSDDERRRRSEHMKAVVAATKAKKEAALKSTQEPANA